ncbi:hypothetical protein HPB50_014257 [Hyalomma asiaticum]|uniref:Uncharacterized protein n=1 Tax=Hyalomma asiaticum TaxID=266040 RepID=A0ACB7TIK1_HYAAI|nr:hypothetical protein HPB50_014257 [Hyalomma asiaticum]
MTHEGIPPGSHDPPAPASEFEPSGGGATETAPDRIITEPGTHAHVHETHPTDKCKVCRRETADLMHILWDCIKHPEVERTRMIPQLLEAVANSYEQDRQLWVVQQTLGALERPRPSEPVKVSGEPRSLTTTSKTTYRPSSGRASAHLPAQVKFVQVPSNGSFLCSMLHTAGRASFETRKKAL